MNLTPNLELRKVAQHYNYSRGFAPVVTGHYVPLDKNLAHEIANAFEAAPAFDPHSRVESAYDQLAIEVRKQWDILEKAGYYLQPWLSQGQPYSNSREMCQDVREHKHLYFFTGGELHPYLGQVDSQTGFSGNEMFRAVHDMFGHAAEGYQFGARGEENAWLHHSQMFSPLAQKALTTDTRGQNSWVNFGPYSHLDVIDRPYAAQKVFLLPDRMTDWKSVLSR